MNGVGIPAKLGLILVTWSKLNFSACCHFFEFSNCEFNGKKSIIGYESAIFAVLSIH